MGVAKKRFIEQLSGFSTQNGGYPQFFATYPQKMGLIEHPSLPRRAHIWVLINRFLRRSAREFLPSDPENDPALPGALAYRPRPAPGAPRPWSRPCCVRW